MVSVHVDKSAVDVTMTMYHYGMRSKENSQTFAESALLGGGEYTTMAIFNYKQGRIGV